MASKPTYQELVNQIAELKKQNEVFQLQFSSQEEGKVLYYNTIINNMGDPVFIKDDKSRLLIVNDAFCELFNLERDHIIGKTLAEDVSPKERESFLKIDKLVLESGIENINEESLTVRGSQTKIISTLKTRYIDSDGNKFLICVVRDITERKKAEEQLKASNQQLQANEQQLSAANQELSAGEQQLRASNQQLRANEQQLRAANQQLQASEEEIKEAYNKIKESEERLNLVIKGSNDAPWDWDLIKDELFYSPQWWKMIGYKPNEIPANSSLWEELTHPEDKAQVDKVFSGALKNGQESYSVEFRLKHKLGYYVPVLSRGFITFNENKKPIRVSGTNLDLTEQKKNSLELLKAKEQAERYLNVAAEIILSLDKKGNITLLNESGYKLLGYKTGKLIGENWFTNCLPEKDVEEIKKVFKQTISGQLKHVANYESNIQTKAGQIRTILWHNSVLQNEDGEITGTLSSGEDITDIKDAEIELIKAREKAEESEEKFSTIFNMSSSLICVADINTATFKFLNHAFKKVLGYEEKELLSKPFLDFIHPDDVKPTIDIIEEKLKAGIPQIQFENRYKRKDGSYCHLAWNSFPVPEKGITYAIAHDITEQKKQEEELVRAKEKAEESEKEFKLLAEAMPQIVWVTRADGWNTYFNQQWVDYTGLTLEESYGEGWNKPFHPDDQKRAMLAWQNAVTNNGIYSLECRIRKFDGSYQWWLVRGVPILDHDGTIIKWYGTCTDIHNIKQNEVELLKAKEKAEESDRLKSAFLANMSHEIRTPMNGILGFTDLLKEPQLTGPERKKYIRIIESSGNRLLNTVNDLIDFSKIEVGQMKVSTSKVNLNELIEQIYTFFKVGVEKEGLQLLLKLPSHIKNLNLITDKEKIYSILTNLIKNAIKYTQRGSIEFGYTLKKDTEPVVAEQGRSTEVEFFVKDTGIGISKEKLEIIFDRFIRGGIDEEIFSEGSGLGLSISKAYVEMLGGKIWVESDKEVGSQFYFTIPYETGDNKIQENEDVGSVAKINPEVSGLKILIAEDDPTSFEFLKILLKNVANKLIHALNGREAIDCLGKNPDIDLVLMDINMPVMNGYEATKEIRKFNKDVIIISQTAYALAGDYDKSIEAGCNDHISKPLNREKLFAKIEKCLIKK